MKNIGYSDYRIVTQDNDGNLSIGYFIIKNVELLNDICRILVQDRLYDTEKDKSICDFIYLDDDDSFDIEMKRKKIVNGIIIDKIGVEDNKIIRCTNFKEEHLHTYYDEYKYEFLYLNTFLIFSSLLGNFDNINYGSIAKNFIKFGIIEKMSFYDAWHKCGKSLVKNKDSKDFLLFRDIVSSGIFVDYVVVDTIKLEDLKDKNILKKLDVMLSEIAYNSELLGTYNKGKHNVK